MKDKAAFGAWLPSLDAPIQDDFCSSHILTAGTLALLGADSLKAAHPLVGAFINFEKVVRPLLREQRSRASLF